MPFTRETMSGCCAAAVYHSGSCRDPKEIPNPSTLTIMWIDAKDTESLEFLSPMAKANVTVNGKVMLSFASDDLVKLKNKAMYDEAIAFAKSIGRKDHEDFRVGDFVTMVGNPTFLYGGKPYRIKSFSNEYGQKTAMLEYWRIDRYDNNGGTWYDYGNYYLTNLLMHKDTK